MRLGEALWAGKIVDYAFHGRKKREMPYNSGEPKFVRERYIRVAAIDTVIRAGVWNNYNILQKA
jgi:hypothetical protein